MQLQSFQQLRSVPNSPLKEDRGVKKELIQGWLREAVSKIQDARRTANSASTRMDVAYDATLFCALAVTAACGFRVGGEAGHHKVVLEGACQAIGAGEGMFDELETLKEWRNRKYRAGFSVSDADVEVAIEIANGFLERVSEYFSKVKPDLLKP